MKWYLTMTKQSDPPKNGTIKIYIPPRLAIVAGALLLGSGVGGLGISNILRSTDAKAESKEPSVKEQFNVRFERLETGQTVNTTKIERLEETTGEIQSVQHKNIARTEARRITDSIPNRKRREKEYDRLVERNLKRIKRGQDPCQDLDCVE